MQNGILENNITDLHSKNRLQICKNTTSTYSFLFSFSRMSFNTVSISSCRLRIQKVIKRILWENKDVGRINQDALNAVSTPISRLFIQISLPFAFQKRWLEPSLWRQRKVIQYAQMIIVCYEFPIFIMNRKQFAESHDQCRFLLEVYDNVYIMLLL